MHKSKTDMKIGVKVYKPGRTNKVANALSTIAELFALEGRRGSCDLQNTRDLGSEGKRERPLPGMGGTSKGPHKF